MNGTRPIVVVTGAARRVGRAIALEMALAGCDVVITYRESAADAGSCVLALRELGASAAAHALDLEDAAAIEALGVRLAHELPRLDALVHNASIYAPTPLSEVSADDALRHYRVNALAPLLLTRALAGRLRASTLLHGGAVVAMADMHALGRPRPGFAPYAMSKAALIEMVRSLARELAPRVRVNAVAPGVVAFPDQGYESDPASQEAYVRRVPLERSGAPEDAARAVRWLALEAGYVTGEVIRVDGGRWLA